MGGLFKATSPAAMVMDKGPKALSPVAMVMDAKKDDKRKEAERRKPTKEGGAGTSLISGA